MQKLKIGDSFPEFDLPSSLGSNISKNDLYGKKTIVYFYPKDDTPGCTTEACDFRDGYQALLDKGVNIIGISADNIKKHQAFIKKYSLPFLLISDEGHILLEALGLWQNKKFMGKEYAGIVRTTYILDSQSKVTAIFEDVSVKGHKDIVVASL